MGAANLKAFGRVATLDGYFIHLFNHDRLFTCAGDLLRQAGDVENAFHVRCPVDHGDVGAVAVGHVNLVGHRVKCEGNGEVAGRDGLEVIDVVLRRPNLESVFLQLTGRDLRQ